jgi:hypothetical protein
MVLTPGLNHRVRDTAPLVAGWAAGALSKLDFNKSRSL